MTATILLVGGGTGGHVFPLVALAEQFEQVVPEVQLRFVGTARGLEAKVIPARGWALDLLEIQPMNGRSLGEKIRASAVAARATAHATMLVRKHRPALVVSVGGYAAGPIALAAAALGVPLALLEPNRVAGLTQKMLKPIARRIYAGFPEMLASLGDKGRAFGIPLRAGFEPKKLKREGANAGVVRVLVTGGSQGAEPLNQRLPAVFAQLAAMPGLSIRVLHQSGRGHADALQARYRAAFDAQAARDQAARGLDEDAVERERRRGSRALPVDVVEFIDDVPARLADADFVVARAGAMTCAELCAVGRASLLIPYPHAADDHQAANAQALADAGAALSLREAHATHDALYAAVHALATDHARRDAMADAARARGAPDAARLIAQDLLKLIDLTPKRGVVAPLEVL